MYRYTTPTLPITISDIDFSEIDLFRIVIDEGDAHLLWSIPADDARVDAEHNTILLELTQEETAQLKKGRVDLQIRIKYTSGKVQATPIAKVPINDVLDEVII